MQEHRDGLKGVGIRTVFHLQIITTPTSDTPGTSVILHFDSKRYMFGEIAEGTQRACIQRGIGLRKVRGLFLAGKTKWNNGGLIGLILSLADIQQGEIESEASNKRPRLHIHAGPMQMHSLACARRFVFRTGMPLSVHEVDAQQSRFDANTGPIHEDENIRVWALCVQPEPENSTALTSTTASGHNSEGSTVDVSQLARDQTLRKDVVNNMFDSEWRRDQLFQSKLKDVKLPAMVWVRNPETKKLVSYTCFDPNNTAPLTPDTEVLVRNPWPASTVEQLPPASGLSEGVSMSYVVKGHAQRGSFDIEKAKSLGLKPGPIFKKLVAGLSVQTEEGQTITPEMVISPTRPGRGFAIFDLPSVDYIPSLQRQLDSRGDQLMEGLQAAIWVTRGGVLYDARFQALLQKHKGIKHIISDPDLCHDYIVHDSNALSSLRLSKIASEFFSVPRSDNLHGYCPQDPQKMQDFLRVLETKEHGLDIMPANRGMKVHLEPNFLVDNSEVPNDQELNAQNVSLEPTVQELLPSDMSPYHRSDKATISPLALSEPEIITLGTGSAAPSKYRNVSAVLLRMPDGMGNYLFDCGEGTLGQLRRVYTAEQLDQILYDLKGIWISHLHADHHLGTVAVLEATYETCRRLSEQGRPRPSPPCLISEVNMIDYLDEYQSVTRIPTESLCTPIACHWHEGMSLRGKPFDFSQTDIPIKELRTVKVNHCHGAQAVSVTFQNGFKFSYSGDCRPNERFCDIGEDSDVLVHEATFDDGMDGDAMAKKHCTTGEAVGVALRMKAKNLILTHFSQRYQKIPVLSSVKMPEHVPEEDLVDDVDAEVTTAPVTAEMQVDVNQQPTSMSTSAPPAGPSTSAWVEPDSARDLNIGIAFDLMRVKVSQIKTMKPLFPAISKMFELEEEKREKQRLAIAAALKEEVDRKKTEKAKAQQAKKEKANNGPPKQKGNNEENSKKNNKKNKRKLEQQEQQQQQSTTETTTTSALAPQAGELPNGDQHADEEDSVNAKRVQPRTDEDGSKGSSAGQETTTTTPTATMTIVPARDNSAANGNGTMNLPESTATTTTDTVQETAVEVEVEQGSPKKRCKTTHD
ncbi:hypothetical protein A1O1_04209 [Capronia coronata CBS 617.96]|uniref:ribonuclease Z n=1 Tax=Capronia coronata CBS 617.96 TaxID=1182541 RepID=W9YDZ3_9EURO|nr:uncharacterized protein A1O1_04209 [Capronia coronata CBS 617.96]EXJ91102.1 hypothetical protein A1O1_04209 [Capronia coronata CBS 617.96]